MQAYVTMRKKKNNQCIVVSGESGAGKTETNRHLLNYLVWRGTDAGSENTLTQKILDANPILEVWAAVGAVLGGGGGWTSAATESG